MKKIIITTMAGLLIIASCIFTYQAKKIDNLENQLTLKLENDQQESNYSQTHLLADSIKETLNKEGSFKVLDGTVSISHTYMLEEQVILGLKKYETIAATANCYYQYTLPLNEAEVTIEGNKINVVLPDVTLDKDATHRVANTFILNEEKSSSSILSNKYTAAKAMRYWEDTFDKRANEHIEDLYKQNDLQKVAEKQVEELLDNFIGEDTKINLVASNQE